MLSEIFTVFDVKANQASPILHARNRAVANRMFRKMVGAQDIPIEELRLLKLGTFDDESLEIVSIEPEDVTDVISDPMEVVQ